MAKKSVKRSAAAKKSFAKRGASKSSKFYIVELAKDGKLCKRKRMLDGSYVRETGKKCKPVEVRTSGEKVVSYRDNIVNSSSSKKITAARKKAKTFRKKNPSKASFN